MKSECWLIALLMLGWLVQQIDSLACTAPFQEVPYGTGSYCAKCDTTCSTCSGSSINSCSTCPTDFTLDTSTATCVQPMSSTINTVVSSYHSYGFQKQSSWLGGDATPYSCDTITVLSGGSGSIIYTTHDLNIHYKVRVRVAAWWFNSNSASIDFALMSQAGAAISSGSATGGVSAFIGGQSYEAYCAGSSSINYEKYVTDATKPVKVTFTSTSSVWGIRQYVFIEYLCYQPDCASCSGPAATECLTCADTNKKIYTLPTAGQCLCKFQNGYYAYPTGNTTYYCVNPCPNLPTGQYYGDNTTKKCVLLCPTNTSNTPFGMNFASDTYGFCVALCPATITLGGSSATVFYDLTNRKCTTICPSTEPYSFWLDRACHSSCPYTGGKQYYKLNTNMSCVDICPNITESSIVAVPLFIDNGTYTCITVCPSGYWGYTNSVGTRSCVLNCPSPLFHDNSTGRPLCTDICPAPAYFGDKLTMPIACVQVCSFGTYGDTTDSSRLCVSKCNSSYYGLQTGNRTCLLDCPSGTWGKRDNLVCVLAPFECLQITITYATAALSGGYTFNASVNSFADNSTRRCILANQSCSNGMFKYNLTFTCQPLCPAGTFAHPITFWCVDACYGTYFADSTLNRCVTVCSPGLFADIGSGNKCVSRCNQTGGYPFRDEAVRKCVKICTEGYADPLAESCVFNCTPGLYLNNSVPTELTCVTACGGNYFAWNSTDNGITGICLLTCPEQPPLFGDVVSGVRLCVDVCQVGTYGDQTNNSYRHCLTDCVPGTFAQNDTLRRCVVRCNGSTFGRATDWVCVNQKDCPLNFTGDYSTNNCTNLCPKEYGTFSDNVSKLCVSKCPIVNTTIYYADIHIRWCIPTCQIFSATLKQFGNNKTQTCQEKCLDKDAFADKISPRRYCIALCTNDGTILYYRDNSTMTCVVSTDCQYENFGDNSTAYCVEKCPNVTGVTTWGYRPTQTCVALCYANSWGDNSTGIPLCVSLCPSLPAKWSYDGPGDQSVMLCQEVCTIPYYGEDYNRTCVLLCPRQPAANPQTYAYNGTRRCLEICPNTTYADYAEGVCLQQPNKCTKNCTYDLTSCSTYRWGDDYNTSCTYLCTATPWDTYGDNVTFKCTTRCSAGSWADNYTGTRICVKVCPGKYDNMGVGVGNLAHDSYGDNFTMRCVLHCQEPLTFADWQTHLCTYRCTGDDNTKIPTYANLFTDRCVVAVSCPEAPDKYFGENVTRHCLPSCLLNSTYYSYADNITRTCIPKCYKFSNATISATFFTMFYGDNTTNRPDCRIQCPKAPRRFGENVSHLCVAECPDHEFGDQTGNRTCVPVCPNFVNFGGVVWFSQLTQRICVTVCEDNTWGNFYNYIGPHCETVPGDCNLTYYADNSTHMCVPICPVSMNYFGDPTTRLCTTHCPYLTSNVTNMTAGIDEGIGRFFADEKTRLCVRTCPDDYGLQGTYGDNSTNTCVQRCPNGSYGDAHTANRFCVSTCTGGAFADDLTMLCVDVCPANPPTFGYRGNWTCMSTCPGELWADSTTRTCESTCGTDFRLSYLTNRCVGVCPSNPDLYGDTRSGNCTAACSNTSEFADPTDRLCKYSCLPLFQYNRRCVKYCPYGYYANALGNCVVSTSCDAGTYGENQTTKCVTPCPAGSYADPTSRFCIAICPDNSYGDNLKCVGACQTPSTNFSTITQVCMATCPNYTYAYNGECIANCTGSLYQNDITHLCDSSCPTGLFADPTSHRCLSYCPTGYYRKIISLKGFCKAQNLGCAPDFADFVTGDCVARCSTGFWGYTGNYTCLKKCPSGQFGYESATERTCYQPTLQPAGTGIPVVFADSVSIKFVEVCPETPIVYFGDRNRHTCVPLCLAYTLVPYFGDPQTRQCQTACQNNSVYTADPITSLCTLKCTYGTFRNNNTKICVNPCPSTQGYGDYTTRICVATCPLSANTFGYYNTSSGSRLCVLVCPDTFYAEPEGRTCKQSCASLSTTISYYAYNRTKECLPNCPDSFADDSNNICVDKCWSTAYPNADNSTFTCVPVCPTLPDYYAQDHICVLYCTAPDYFADSYGRQCVTNCSNTTGASGYIQYGDPRTGRCQVNCSEGTWGYNDTNLCVEQCGLWTFADNTTGKCVAECPKIEGIYADPLLRVCAYTCSGGYFGSQINQTCIPKCETDYWGDPTTTLCTLLCPVKIYSYGQNVTRTCVRTCYGYTGYADNYSRLCRSNCQNSTPVQTFADPTTLSCVQKCPQNYYAYNLTNKCQPKCLAGSFADNYSQYCVTRCPSDPESYGDQTSFICIYSCRFGQFSDNSTNLCVTQCPGLNTSLVDYYGDPVTGRCVIWCTENTYARNDTRLCVNPCPANSYADNLTRRCVTDCPPTEFTYADPISHRCVRICPTGRWAENTTQKCETGCITYTNLTLGYADNLTNYCVAKCPFGYFGSNSSHNCVVNCSETLDQYGHPIGRVCVALLDCYGDLATGQAYYADSTTRTCVVRCPLTLWADTHLRRCVPACDSVRSPPQFRNRHTQMCVWPCPSDPDEYADSSTGNCVRTCSPNSYAYTGNHTCLSSCGSFGLFADDTTNRCVAVCATSPYLYADNLTWKCTTACSGLQFADNRTQTCVRFCPAQWSYFGQTHNYTCVSLCPDGEFADTLDNRLCKTTCSGGYFTDNFTSTCVQHCRLIRPYYYEDISLGFGRCVETCPGEGYGYNPDQTCKYQDIVTSASTCPGSYYADRSSRECVLFCPNGTFSFITTKYCQPTCSGTYYADPILRKCVTTCSNNLFKLIVTTSINRCVQYCPNTHYAQNSTVSTDAECVGRCTSLVGLSTTRTCESKCPHPFFADWGNNVCVTNCTPLISYMPNRTCLDRCDLPYYGNPINFTCDLLCPLNYFGRNDTRLCDTGCPSLSYADPSIRICVQDCPSYPLLFADDRWNKCLPGCDTPLFAFLGNRTCLSSCPNITQGGVLKIYLADASNRMCVLECVNEVISFADFIHNVCTQFCPSGFFADNYTKKCVPVCPNVPNDTFSDNTSHICMDVCLPGTYGNHDTLNCVRDCVLPFYADNTTRTCVIFCPDGFFAENSSATCRTTCPTNSFADPVTHRCLAQCPALQSYFNYHGNWTCLLNCPPGFYANTDNYTCVSICNTSNGMFSYGPTHLCVRECPIPYRGFSPNRSCVLDCPAELYFYDVTINVCALCNINCTICVSVTNCIQCKPGFNLFNGFCNQSCIPTNIITYADLAGICVALCPAPLFGNNETYACVDSVSCPAQQYGEPTTRLCANCPSTCAFCDNFTYCTTCQASATLSLVDHMCYADCNSTFKYSYNGSCWNTCPAGSYLTYTNVLCASCAALCLTCSGTPNTCTSCAATYFYNSTCLTTCPKEYYGATSLQCLPCNSSVTATASCASPLNFTTTFGVENFQYVITMQFNQNVSIEKQLADILKINLKVNRLLAAKGEKEWIEGGELRRMLQVGTLINNGVPYTYEILSNGTIKIYLQINANLINPTFSVSISDPAAVISTATGISLQNVQSLLNIPMIEYYPETDGKEAGTNFPAKFVAIFVLLLYGLTFVFSDCMVRPLQVLQIYFLHCLASVGVPANIYYFLLQLKLSLLPFLQNWFSSYLPVKSLYYDTPPKIGDVCVDYVFLRNVGQLFLLMVVLASFWFVFLILGNKRVVIHKIWHSFLSEVSQKRYGWMVYNDLLSLFYLPILYFAFMQMNHFFGDGFYAFNGFVALVFSILAIITPVIYHILWFRWTPQQLAEKLWFLTIRVKRGEKAAAVHEINEEQKSNVAIKEEKRSASAGSMRSEVQESTEHNPSHLQGIIFYYYLLLTSVWLVGLYSYPQAQMGLLLTTNLAYLIYLLRWRPFLNSINLVFSVMWVMGLITLECFYIYFQVNEGKLYASEKTSQGYPFVITLCVIILLVLLWSLWRSVWEVMFLWQNFKKTLLYLEFADHEYEGEKEKTEEYSQYEKMAQLIDTGLGDVIVDQIRQQLNSEGQKVIRIRKKVMKKKQKVQGRKKNHQALPEEQELDFVRVNQVNVFDYDRFREDEPEEVPQPRRRVIDDDLRDLISDNSDHIPSGLYREDDEEEKKIEVDVDQIALNNIDDLSEVKSNINEKSKKEKIFDYLFDDIEDESPRNQKNKKEEEEEEREQEKMSDNIADMREVESYRIDNEDLFSQVRPVQQPHKAEENYSEVDFDNYDQIKSQSVADHQPQVLPSLPLQPPSQPSQLPSQSPLINIDLDEAEEPAGPTVEAPKVKNIDDLLAQEESGKNKKNLLFLFDDFEED